ncbi:hypothetical protein QQF64_034487 [Cirrhinus molitorella]|uniref:Ig-like domain-containing protein n=1 Tax=Cirrhinus molitorella TaxID=172907 RepID=A0ABR3L4P3_9TELE
MAAYTTTKIFSTLIGFWLVLGVECVFGGSNHVTIPTGGSVTIPCYYDKKYTQQRKYWNSETAKSKTYTNTTEENLSVIDHPDQSLFTVTMRNLWSTKPYGRYYCAVEIEGKPTLTYDFYLQVQSAPDVSVVNRSVSGHEGGDISVQCLYSSRYLNKIKQFCRYEDRSCYTVGRTDTSQNSSVQISDDGRGSFTVLMTGLRLTDSGWYFCSAGETVIPVQLTVEGNTEKNTLRQRPKQGKHHIRDRDGSGTTDRIYSYPEDPVIYSNINDETPNDLSYYCTIDYIPGSEAVKLPAVQWENLQTSDSGYYWCAVEIGDYNVLDAGYYLYLTDKPKQWCRFKDKGCYTVGKTDTSQNSSVQIRENDGRRSFTVLMTGLRLNDSGWYFCTVGDLQVPVQLTITKPKREFITIPAATPSDSETDM